MLVGVAGTMGAIGPPEGCFLIPVNELRPEKSYARKGPERGELAVDGEKPEYADP